MTDGWWRIKQHAPNAPGGFLVTEIPLALRKEGGTMHATSDPWTKPTWWVNGPVAPAITFKYPDGREEYFPWASIVHAEYQPPTKDTE